MCVCLMPVMEMSSVPIGKGAGPVSSASQLCPSRTAAAKGAWPNWTNAL